MFLQDSISNLSEQERVLKQEVEQAQAQQEAEDRRQQQLQERRAKAAEEEAKIVSKLEQTKASIAQLHGEMQQVPVLSEVSQSEEEDLAISSSDESDSESDSDHTAAALQNGYHDPPPRANPNDPQSSSNPNGLVAGANGKQLSLTQMLQQLCSDNRPRPQQLGSLVSLMGHDQLEAQAKEVRAADWFPPITLLNFRVAPMYPPVPPLHLPLTPSPEPHWGFWLCSMPSCICIPSVCTCAESPIQALCLLP